MKWPWVSRKEYNRITAEFEARLHDIERHFVTKRDPDTGEVTETLADRTQRKYKPKRVTWQQTRSWLEATDDGRRCQNWISLEAQEVHGVKLATKAEEKAAGG